MNGRTKTFIVAVSSGLIGRSVALLSPLVVMGPMLSHLGTVLFGIWLTATSMAALANFLDFGIGNATLTRLSEAFGKNNLLSARSLLGQAYTLLATLGGACILLTLAATLVAMQFLPETSVTAEQVTVVAIVLCALFLTFCTGLLVRLLQSRQSYVHANIVQSAGPLFAMSASLMGIALDLSPVAVVALYAAAAPTTQALWTTVYFVRRPSLRPAFHGLDKASIGGLVDLGGAFFVVSILTSIGMNMDNLIIAASVGAEAVTDFGVPARLGTLLLFIIFTVFMPLWSLFGDALARGDRTWLSSTALRASLAGSFVVLVIGLGLVMFADDIIQIWMGRAFPNQQRVLLGLVLSATLIAATSPFNMILNAAGMARQQILPWATFVSVSAFAKVLLIAPQTTWWAPWITAATYMLFVTPRILQLAIGRMRAIPS
jgi:O-antigen/teichoic acid export membrane protein